MKSRLLIIITVILILTTLINTASVDPSVTPKDKAALRKFRPEVDHFLPHDWMKEDWYLLRWIRQKKFDLDGAKELLQKNIEWRKENNMDKLEYDPKSALARDFPITEPGVDNEGRAGLPVYLDVAIIKESYYPLALKECVVVNAPRIFQTVLRLTAPILGNTVKQITILGVNQEEWKGYVLERIPADQLPAKYGGTQQS